ncbi:hypothetical protein ACOMHN_039579 [Nucella lapillus]
MYQECEDGRDETGDCPYSSPHCHGKIALCDRCYTIVDSLRDFVTNTTNDINKRADGTGHFVISKKTKQAEMFIMQR